MINNELRWRGERERERERERRKTDYTKNEYNYRLQVKSKRWMRVPVFHKNTCHDFSIDIITHPPGIDPPPQTLLGTII